MSGRLLGIARKARPKAAVEAVESSRITFEGGVAGDFRGAIRPGRSNKRQVTLFSREDWEAALDELGAFAPWTGRRCNLYVEGVVLPRDKGARLRVGESATFEITGECDPCRRMNEVVDGLEAVLIPGWRGGRLARVIAEGEIKVGDAVVVEE